MPPLSPVQGGQPEFQRPNPKRQHHHVAHDVGGRDKKDWSEQSEKRGLERRGVCAFIWRAASGVEPPARSELLRRRARGSSPLQSANALGEGECSQNRHRRPEEEGGVKGDFAPAEDRADGRDIVGTQRRILHDHRHWLRKRRPVYIETVRIEWMFGDLLGHPKEKWIVNVKGFIEEGRERRSGNEHKQRLCLA